MLSQMFKLYGICCSLLAVVYHIIKAIIRLFIPSSLLPRKSLNGELALVTGAGSGIGREVARCLSRQGCKLILWDINEAGNNETRDMIIETGSEAYTYTVDVSNRHQVYATADKVREEVGEVSLLISNAGIISVGEFLKVSDERIQKIIDVNFIAQYWMVKAFLPSMLERDHGHIAATSSFTGVAAMPMISCYSSSKYGVMGLMEALELELKLKTDNIKVTRICLGSTDTPLVKSLDDQVPEHAKIKLPMLKPEDAAEKIVQAIQTSENLLIYPWSEAGVVILLKRLLPTDALFKLLEMSFPSKSDMQHFNIDPTDSSHQHSD